MHIRCDTPPASDYHSIELILRLHEVEAKINERNGNEMEKVHWNLVYIFIEASPHPHTAQQGTFKHAMANDRKNGRAAATIALPLLAITKGKCSSGF